MVLSKRTRHLLFLHRKISKPKPHEPEKTKLPILSKGKSYDKEDGAKKKSFKQGISIQMKKRLIKHRRTEPITAKGPH
jgi:hypothetical protein